MCKINIVSHGRLNYDQSEIKAGVLVKVLPPPPSRSKVKTNQKYPKPSKHNKYIFNLSLSSNFNKLIQNKFFNLIYSSLMASDPI